MEQVIVVFSQGAVSSTLSTLALIGRIALGILVFTYFLPMRPHRILRCTASLLGIFILDQLILITLVCVFHVLPLINHPRYIVFMLVYFTIIFAGFVAATVVIYDISWWSALFCCAAGYTLQNLASGITELIWMVIQRNSQIGDEQRGMLMSFHIANCVIAIAVCTLAFMLLLPYLRSDGIAQVRNRGLLLMMAAVSFLIIGFDLTIKYVADSGIALSVAVMLRLIHICLCIFIIWMEFELLINSKLRAENLITQHVLHERERQYQLSKQMMDAVNIKSHDLKHHIRQLATQEERIDAQTVRDIESTIAQYDASVSTGNEALDTILTEKSLQCVQEQITLSIIADGSALSGMHDADIYSLFGNALDNAIEAVRPLDTGRSISVNIRQTMGVASIHIENSMQGKAQIVAGLPQTTKPDTNMHGFGTRSMREICERYGATLNFIAEPGRFIVNILLPLA